MNVATRTCFLACLSAFCATGSARDEGMWLINKPPMTALKRHGFEPSPAWLEHAQKSAVRFQTGGSGSFVSPDGLVMTNHHVGSDMLSKLSTPERNLLDTGFLAGSRDAELKCPDLELNVLWSIEDVTDRVNGAVSNGMSTADAGAARRKAINDIEKTAGDKSGLKAEVVTLYQGGRYHLYLYKHFTDVRLAFAPEQAAAFFGGDTDNFEFPRYNFDVCLFRVYEDGKPYRPEHYLRWSATGSKEGDLAIVIGHPGKTDRLNTTEHLRFVRDTQLPFRLRQLWRAEAKALTFAGRSAEQRRLIMDDYFGIANSRKAFTGELAGLLDPAIFAAKSQEESKLRAAVEENPEWKAKWSDAWEKIAAAEKARAGWHARYAVLNRPFMGSLFAMARDIVRLAEELPKPSGDRLREYSDAGLASLYLELYSPAPVHTALELHRLTSGLSQMAELFGADDPLVKVAIAGLSPEARARQLVTGTTLTDPAARRKLVEGGRAAVDASTDPVIRLAAALDGEARELRRRFEDEVESVERDNYARIAQAKFAVEGDNAYPDATFTLRMAFGPIAGYPEGGTTVPAYTRLGGLFERYDQRKGQEGFELPQRWLDAKGKLKLDTPFNFVCSADIIGGNSGSPVINTNGEVIGLIFDGNIHSLPGAFVYDPRLNRAVAVDSRGIIECMRTVFAANTLADEMLGKAEVSK